MQTDFELAVHPFSGHYRGCHFRLARVCRFILAECAKCISVNRRPFGMGFDADTSVNRVGSVRRFYMGKLRIAAPFPESYVCFAAPAGYAGTDDCTAGWRYILRHCNVVNRQRFQNGDLLYSKNWRAAGTVVGTLAPIDKKLMNGQDNEPFIWEGKQ